MSVRLYKVEFTIIGDVEIAGPINFRTVKELQPGDIFDSEITIENHPSGLRISCTVFTSSQDRAYKVGLIFVGRMLDVLSMKIDIRLVVYNNDFKTVIERNTAKAIINQEEFRRCFDLSRTLNANEPVFLTGLSWYRKGLYTDDSLDKFLAFWNSISIVCGKYHTRDVGTAKGIKNQIYNCFVTLWGNDIQFWPLINGDGQWINSNNSIRDNIAHGLIPVEITSIETVIDKLSQVREVAHLFLTKWGNEQFKVNYRF